MAKAPVKKGGSLVPTRVDRIAKRVKTDIVSLKMDSVPHTISVQAAQIVEIPGFVLAATPTTITLRHRARAASLAQASLSFWVLLVVPVKSWYARTSSCAVCPASWLSSMVM